MKKGITFAGIFTFILFSLVSLGTSQAFAAKELTIKGSDTMVHLVSAWAEAYMKSKPGSSVSVTGGGSGVGISALINKTADIASSSRDMKPQEIAQAKQNGVNPKGIVVARDGITIVVNPKNPVKALSMEQLKKIYTGAYTNWNQVGGANQKITLLSRESSSGTYVFFQEHVLNKEDYAQSARLLPATSAIVQSVEADSGAIGYVGLGYADKAGRKLKEIPVKKTDSSPAIAADDATVESGAYPIARALYLYVSNPPSAAAMDFVNFAKSAKGQEIVKQQDYVSIK